MDYPNPAGQGGALLKPVAWKFVDSSTKVLSCERHADELVGARRMQ
jgi:hypothetical protein